MAEDAPSTTTTTAAEDTTMTDTAATTTDTPADATTMSDIAPAESTTAAEPTIDTSSSTDAAAPADTIDSVATSPSHSQAAGTTDESQTAAASSSEVASTATAIVTPASSSESSAASTAHVTPTASAAAATAAAVPSVDTTPIHIPRRHDVWLTPTQVANENKKLAKGCGWHWYPINPAAIARPASLALIESTPRQPRARKQLNEEESAPPTPAPLPPTPSGRSKKSVAPVAVTPAPKKGTKRTMDPADEKKRMLDDIEERIAALRNEQAAITGTPHASSASSVASYPDEKSASKNKRRKTNPPAAVAVPAPSTPAAAPATPGVSSHGRKIKAPQAYAQEQAEEQEIGAEVKQLKKCRILLDHLINHKVSQGVFSVPVNYEDPSKMYFAPNYLAIIGASNRPIDLTTIRTRLLNNEYQNTLEFAADVRMVYRNAMLYNPPGDWIYKAASDCLSTFEREIERIETGTDKRKSTGGSISAYAEEPYSKRPKAGSRTPATPAGNDSQSFALIQEMAERIRALESKISEGGATPTVSATPTHHVSPPLKPVTPYRPPAPPAAQPAYKKAPAQPKLQPLTQREKQALKDDIFKLPSHKLGPVVEMISKAMPATEQKDDADEIEIDIDTLDIPTLRDLQGYVKKALIALKKTSNTKPTQPRRSTPSVAAQPRSSPASKPPAHASPAAAANSSPFARTPAAAMQSPSRLETPATPNMNRATSQAALGNTTPALKYDSSSDDSDSSDSSDSDDDDNGAYTSHVVAQPLDEPMPGGDL